MVRPLSGENIAQLERRVDVAGNQADLQLVLDELAFRSTRAARRLEARVRTLLSGSPRSAAPIPRPAQHALPGVETWSTKPPTARGNGRGVRAREEHPPTPEQNEAINAFLAGGSLKVAAFAGAGKTSTLKMMARRHSGRGLYLAFNKKIAREARQSFPDRVDCRTTHSLAMHSVQRRYNYSRGKMFDPINALKLAALLRLEAMRVDQNVEISAVHQAFLIQAAVRRFCQGDTETIEKKHVPKSLRLASVDDNVRAQVNDWVLDRAKGLWARMLDANDDIPLGHDGYLKLWSLGRPRLACEYVLLDEAQDSNAAVLAVLKAQDAQIVYVGDRHQQIYEWRGAVNAMAKINTDRETALTQSFRFGPEIAAEATRILARLGEHRALQGNPAIRSEIGSAVDTDAVLARTNAVVITETLAALDRGRTPFIVGGTDELEELVRDVYRLMEGEPGLHPDFFGFKNWSEVVTFANGDEGESLRAFVTLVQQNGPGVLWAAIRHSADDEATANVSISTAHKAKGCEWSSVRLATDFTTDVTKDVDLADEESRLFYVAITRAKRVLSVDPATLAAFTAPVQF
jgi:superfamily I DNA/RNA helicase